VFLNADPVINPNGGDDDAADGNGDAHSALSGAAIDGREDDDCDRESGDERYYTIALDAISRDGEGAGGELGPGKEGGGGGDPSRSSEDDIDRVPSRFHGADSIGGFMSDRKMPIKTVDIDFTEDGYPGFTCKRRLNLSFGLIRRSQEPEDETESRRVLLEIFPEWDFVDEKGKPIPHTVEGFDLIPQELALAMVRRGGQAAREAAMPANLDGNSSEPVEMALT